MTTGNSRLRKARQSVVLTFFSDYKIMLAETKPDFVLALGRHSAMAEIAHYLLDNGLPFLMEKPLGINAAEVLGISEKAEALNGFAAVPLFQRYMPYVEKVQAMIADGSFGTISHIQFRGNRPTSERYPQWGSAWMLDPAQSGGGCLRNLGTHGIDMFLHLTGEAAEVIAAQTSNRGLGQLVEDYAAVHLRSESGILGAMEFGNLFPYSGPDRAVGGDGGFTICGRDAMLSFGAGSIRVVTAEGLEVIKVEPAGPPSARMLRETLNCWQAGEAPPVTARECYRAQRLVDRAYELAGPLT
ncbi:MAG: Gfo/Idh/MocA family oxidoreductase [Proteobacteria bacterium]|nr:Gfo/Idh/MocA family oxidoreductase [Pseudomonadota bacterium]